MEAKQKFLIQTALDYDMPINEVERIYKNNKGSKFYEALELYILNRSERLRSGS